jgi:hypothetical protein
LRAILETDEIEVWFGIYNNVNFYSLLFGQVFREFQNFNNCISSSKG